MCIIALPFLLCVVLCMSLCHRVYLCVILTCHCLHHFVIMCVIVRVMYYGVIMLPWISCIGQAISREDITGTTD